MKSSVKNLFSGINKKKLLCFLLMVFVLVLDTYADASGTNQAFTSLKKVFGTIYAFFTSTYMLVICTIGLIVIGVGMIMNRGEPVVLKKLIPWLCAVILIGSASAICSLFFNPSTTINGITDGTYVLDGWS